MCVTGIAGSSYAPLQMYAVQSQAVAAAAPSAAIAPASVPVLPSGQGTIVNAIA